MNSTFFRSVATLSLGTILAQLVMIIAAPILTRLYTPVDFGLAALFAAIVSSVAPAICGKYEVAVVVVKSIQKSKQLLGIAIITAITGGFIAFFSIYFFEGPLSNLFDLDRLGIWALAVPFALFSTGVLASLNYYSNRVQDYRTISQSKVLIATIGVIVSITLGAFDLYYGLLLSSIVATTSVSLWLIYRYRLTLRTSVLRNFRRKRIIAWRHREFPIYSASTGLLDGITQALPVFFLSRYFPDSTVGYYALMLRVAMAPISFVSSSVSQVNLKKIADLVNQGNAVRPYLLRVTLLLTATVLPISLVLIFFAPTLFSIIFGEEWRLSGTYLQIIMPAIAVQFIASTVSTTFGATGNNRLGAIWKLTAFIVTFSMFTIVTPRVNASGIFIAILTTNLVLYGLYYFLAWRAAGQPKRYQ